MFEWVFVAGIFVAFYNAWGGGANDCANSFATSVGSGVLTLKKALLIASVFEFSGAVLMGSHVTDMVRKQIVSIDAFEDNPGVLMIGMLCADLSSAIWLTIATYFQWPVSTTHSIIGAIVGFSLAYKGNDAVSWDKIGLVVASWVISPLLAGVFSSIFFFTINTLVFSRDDPVKRIIMLIPILVFFTFLINTLFIIYKGSPQLDLDETPLGISLAASAGISLFTALIARYVYVPYVKKQLQLENETTGPNTEHPDNIQVEVRTASYKEATGNDDVPAMTLTNVDLGSSTTIDNDMYDGIQPVDRTKSVEENILQLETNTKLLKEKKKSHEIAVFHENAQDIDPKADELCSWVQIITACFSSFAHGSNDVANAVAPLATIYHIYQKDSISESASVPIWVLVLGGAGIVFGLATWGYKIIERMGKQITKISPSRGFIVEMASALTVIIASRAELPVSTTHCQVGSIVGCGLIGGKNNVKWGLLHKILMSWLVTLPVTGLISAGLFSFAYFSPNELNENIYDGNGSYYNISNFTEMC